MLRLFVRRGLLPADDALAMAQWEHGGGVSVDASGIEAPDRAGRERLLRYCARPPFALDRLRELDPERLLYESTKPGPGGNGPLLLTPLELLDRLAALVPRRGSTVHRYFGVLARMAAHWKFPGRPGTAEGGRSATVGSLPATSEPACRKVGARQRGERWARRRPARAGCPRPP